MNALNSLKRCIKLLDNMVSFDTSNPKGNEKPLADFLNSHFKKLGGNTKVIDIGNNRANVVAEFGTNKACILVLNGHLDVVPAGENWHYNPFSLTIHKGKAYGRGTVDMKGAIASMIIALENVLKEKTKLNVKVRLVFTADEEDANRGIEAYFSNCNYKCNLAVIGEPTQMDICLGHRGVDRKSIRIKGKSCHAGKPQMGINPITYCGAVAQEIENYNINVLSKRKCNNLLSPTIAVTRINGGFSNNVVPEDCTLIYDRRTVTKDTKKSLRKEITQMLNKVSENKRLFNYEITDLFNLSSGEISKENAMVDICKKVYTSTFGEKPTTRSFDACCEQSLFQKKDINCIICGPGSLSAAHTTDEYIEVSQLEKAIDFYYQLIKEFASLGERNET